MAWTTPGTAVAGTVLTSSFWNEQVRDNLAYLKDLDVPLNASNSEDTAVTASSSFASAISVTITGTGKPILITWGIRVNNANSGAERSAEARLYKNGSAVGVSTGEVQLATPTEAKFLSGSYIDSSPSGSTTYAIYVKASAATSVQHNYRSINACEVK